MDEAAGNRWVGCRHSGRSIPPDQDRLVVRAVPVAAARWPEALVGSIDLGDRQRGTLQLALAKHAVVDCLLLGALKLYWAAGGTLAIDPANLEHRDVCWRLLSASTGACALAGAGDFWQ